MASERRRLKGLAGAIGFSLGTVLLSALVRTGTASAQCGPVPGGNGNTACGEGALPPNTTGHDNSALGSRALFSNTTGDANTASGADALFGNTEGSGNTASGSSALANNIKGSRNTASGAGALDSNMTGDDNTASGSSALANETKGHSNIALGVDAGSNIVAGSNDIEIGGSGTADESNTTRIGLPRVQTRTFIAGIFGKTVNANGVPVIVDNTGKLGVAVSSARYKRNIRDMGAASAGLLKLRPVTFRYKSDPSGLLQYGLVAEEVERVYPELVTRDTDGKLQSVRYQEFTALLLNELQKQSRQLAAQQREIDALTQQNASINTLSQRLAALEQQAREVRSEPIGSLASK